MPRVVTPTATGATTTGSYADLPAVVRAVPDPVTVDANTLPPGTAVPASAIGQRAPAGGTIVYGLADSRSSFGLTYPAVSTDGGVHWRIDGPIFYRAAAEGASGASGIFVAGRLVCVPGVDGNDVRMTTDGGRHWSVAMFPTIMASLVVRSGRLIAAVQDSPTNAADVYATRDYVSSDDGATWYLQGAVPGSSAAYGG